MLGAASAWYVLRAGGLVAYALLSLSSAVGLLLSGRVRPGRWPRFAVEDVHRFVSILAGAFVVLHVGGILVDTYVPFSPSEVFVPFGARYRPLATGLGTVAAELLLALAIANRLRDRLGHRLWRRLHYLAFAVWALATVHAVAVGSDRSSPWFLGVYALAVGAVFALAARRALGPRLASGFARGLAAATAGVVAVELVVVVGLR